MANEREKAELAAIWEEVQQQLRVMAQLHQERAQLTASASVRRKRVTVTVNADNAVIATQFGPDIAELEFGEIAKAIVQAAQQASAEVARRNRELLTPVRERMSRLPKLSELIEGLPDMDSHIPEPPTIPTTRPGAPERANTEPEAGARRSSIIDTSW